MTSASQTATLPATAVVGTTQGKVRGTVENGHSVFRGVPYAEPPTGRLRFEPPARREPWDGVREATRFGPSCPQGHDPVEAAMMKVEYRPPQGEDCLSLNVWTPDLGAAGLPVLVWLHGGSLKFGAGSDPIYDGSTFARDGIVVVTLNYRLHPFGFLHVGDRPGSGAFGLLDQIAALEWVAENIAAFGGDPGAVTVAGESAGAHSVGQLLAAPAARGLFGRAILQSGAAGFHLPAEAAEVVGSAVLARLGVGSDDDDALASLMSGDLLAANADVEPRMLDLLRERGIRPNVMSATARVTSLSAYGGDVVPTRALDAISDGAARGVDLLVGTNLDETALFGPQYASSAPDVADVAFGPRASAVLNQYRARRTGQPAVDAMTSFMTDSLFRIPAIQLAEAAQAHSARTYMYLLAYGSPPSGERRGAMHGLDLPFMWDRLDNVADALFDLAGLERAPELATAMHGAWAAFVTTGAPEHPTLPEWPAYDPLRRATMLLDRQSRVVDDPLGEDRALWDGVEY